MRFFLTICAIAVAISFPSAESAGASGNKVSADGKFKVRENDYIEVKIPEFEVDEEYIISVSCGAENGEEEICGIVQANGFDFTGDFELKVEGCTSVNQYKEKYCKVDIQEKVFTFNLKIKKKGKDIRVLIVGKSLKSAEWLQKPGSGNEATLTKRTGALITGERLDKGNQYRAVLTCENVCKDSEARGQVTDDVTASVGTEWIPDGYCPLTIRYNSNYKECLPGPYVPSKLYFTLTANENTQYYEAFFLVTNLKDIMIYTTDPGVTPPKPPTTPRLPGQNSTTAAQNGTTPAPGPIGNNT